MSSGRRSETGAEGKGERDESEEHWKFERGSSRWAELRGTGGWSEGWVSEGI
jgi:hypothetical protein